MVNSLGYVLILFSIGVGFEGSRGVQQLVDGPLESSKRRLKPIMVTVTIFMTLHFWAPLKQATFKKLLIIVRFPFIMGTGVPQVGSRVLGSGSTVLGLGLRVHNMGS